jgi:CheY-like chemotaxis protein
MRLDFNILWVEDLQHSVQAQKEKLERLIRSEGFRLKVQFAISVEEAKKYITDNVFSDHIDLILMDYNLDDGPNGDEGLKEVRRTLPYKDVIFYSAQANNLREYLKAADVSGVYLSSRDDLPDTADGVFQSLVKKVLDIDHSRGLVMGATSDIDHYVNDSLLHIFENSSEKTQQEIIKKILEKIEKIKTAFDANVQELREIDHISQLFEKHFVYTSADRLHLLRKALKLVGGYDEQDKIMLEYAEKIMPKRNDLAHIRVEIEGFSRKLLNKKGEEFTSEEMRTLRLALLEKQEAFEKIFSSLTAKAA